MAMAGGSRGAGMIKRTDRGPEARGVAGVSVRTGILGPPGDFVTERINHHPSLFWPKVRDGGPAAGRALQNQQILSISLLNLTWC
jgi:hypothetical protein